MRGYYEKLIFPNMTAEQKAMLVPGSFGSNVNHYPNGTYICDKVGLGMLSEGVCVCYSPWPC